ncbi:hypothetical protein GQ43DRAFT_402090 [Delitschia confertaspora ATCC 74209]|uniref:ferric-chelate reductase (NADPH) n=1 Tax=Delitschia confertaspora ATCC 74209 TaxID=1513339 RepID=A0A9P4JER8_9PLEO|nr:hypothetical protein GQ43DRAFT_402090 [Delitschia confertaspora ATCC 74209]
MTLRRPWDVLPGQYLYLTLPSIPHYGIGYFQSHPFLIAWVDGSDVTVLIQRGKGFSESIFTAQNRSSVLVDGPYGHSPPLGEFDRVLFMASGIGIAAHLLSVKHLLEAHENQSARIRRLTLVWFLETSDQEAWAGQFLDLLHEMDRRHIFTVALYLPSSTSGGSRILNTNKNDRWIRTETNLDPSWFIYNEWSAEAGSMAISVCGNPFFEEAVRRAVHKSDKDIHFYTAEFHPEETPVSRLSNHRVVTTGKSNK